MDLTTLFGIVIGIGGILLGNMVEGGHFGALVQGASFVIVLTGTMGAVLVSSRRDDLKLGFRMLGKAFQEDTERENESILRSLMDCARIAKKDSLLALEAKIPNLSNEFMQTAMRSVLDGMDPQLLEDTLHQQLDVEEEHLLAGARIWTDAGGYAPTIGIIGAVLGLIHVMGNLTDTSKLGSGIAVAFVATIYGVGFANLLFLPIGNKLKRKIQQDMKGRQMIIAGALGIQAGLSPALLEMKLRAYLGSSYEKKN